MKCCSRIRICSTQVYLLVVLISSVHFQSMQASFLGNETDKLALLHFKESITVDPLRTLNTWNSSVPHCCWSGVACNIRHQRVTNLTLNGLKLSGPISPHIGNLSFLRVLDLENNSFHGEIPQQVGKLFRLQVLYLNNNTLEGEIPINLTSCSNLKYLDLQLNNLSGKILPLLGSLLKLQVLALSANTLTGMIPSSLGNLTSLQVLTVAGNRLVGEIPGELSGLKKLFMLLVGSNNLSGVIPPFLFNISSMEEFVFASNKFHGGLPDKGFNLPNLGVADFGMNQLSAVVLSLLFWKKQSKLNPTSSILGPKPHIMVSYKNLHDATSGFSSQNLVGYGSFGSVYKGLLDQMERPVAVKVLNLQQQGAAKSIVAECNALSNIRHRNLLKLLTYCSSLDYQGNDFKALVFEFMPNGSLENWLHSEVNQPPRRLNLQQRLSIAIDVASALHYLHDLYEVPIVHRDLKPSNVLLDDDMVAHVGDFGLAKFLSTSQGSLQSQSSTLAIRGTTGYVAPEYGLGAPASKEADIYSYGILLLEMFTGRRPTDDTFTDGLNLVDFIKEALPERAIQVADPVLRIRDLQETEAASSSAPLARDENQGHREIELARTNMKMRPHEVSCLTSVLEIGIVCSEESPSQRANLGDVLRKLHKVKDAFMIAQFKEERRRSRQPREYYSTP